jgi:hypothetical protein
MNFFGESLPSDIITVAASTLPDKPNAVKVDWTKSSKTALYVYWDKVAEPASPILGYQLQMDDGKGG